MGLGDNIFESLKATQGDVTAQAAVMAGFLLSAAPEGERQPLRDALDAAAVLHWFDPWLLHQVLAIPFEEARRRFQTLKTLNFVEPYDRGDRDLYNVHEATRLGWRKLLAEEVPVRFRALSVRAADCFAEDLTPAGRTEWIYHLLCGDPEAGATALEALSREWDSSARPEDRYILATTLDELESTGLVAGRARVWTLLDSAWTRESRGETTQLADIAAEVLHLARETEDERAEADAQCLVGGVLEAQGQLEAAQAAFGEDLAISRRLAEQDPSNADLQWSLSVAHHRIGGVLQAQGKLDEALAAFQADLAIFEAAFGPEHPNVASVINNLGMVMKEQGDLAGARAAYERALAICEQALGTDHPNTRTARNNLSSLDNAGG